jgi:hypothetical protein
MSSSKQNHNADSVTVESSSKSLYAIGGVAAILQLAFLLAYSIIVGILGSKPTSAAEYFAIYQGSHLEAFLRGDFLMMILIGLYLGTFPALYVALRRLSPVYTALATLFTLITVALAFANESSFSLQHLGDQYTAATTDAQRTQLLAAGQAVIASDMWNSSSAYMSGILLQGAGAMISVIMLRSQDFSKVTAYAGLLGNGFDLIQHILDPFAPTISGYIKMFMGLFYFVWFPMLARDFFKIRRNSLQRKG